MKFKIASRGIILLLIALTISGDNYGQMPKFLNQYSIPALPSINDSILIIDSVWTPSPSCTRTSYSVSFSGDSIFINNCYRDTTGWSMLAWIKDTTKIGRLSAGTYHCLIYSKLHISGTDSSYDCLQLVNRDSITFSFTVSKYPNGINEDGSYRLIIFPNPATDKLYINNLPQDATLSVTDMTGRILNLPVANHQIDISSLPSGIYCLRIQNIDGSVVKKFVKE